MGNGSFIDGLPINSMVIFHGYVAAMLNNQMVIQLFQTLASSIWLPVDFIRIGKELRKELCNNQGKQEVLFIYVYIYIPSEKVLAGYLITNIRCPYPRSVFGGTPIHARRRQGPNLFSPKQ